MWVRICTSFGLPLSLSLPSPCLDCPKHLLAYEIVYVDDCIKHAMFWVCVLYNQIQSVVWYVHYIIMFCAHYGLVMETSVTILNQLPLVVLVLVNSWWLCYGLIHSFHHLHHRPFWNSPRKTVVKSLHDKITLQFFYDHFAVNTFDCIDWCAVLLGLVCLSQTTKLKKL